MDGVGKMSRKAINAALDVAMQYLGATKRKQRKTKAERTAQAVRASARRWGDSAGTSTAAMSVEDAPDSDDDHSTTSSLKENDPGTPVSTIGQQRDYKTSYYNANKQAKNWREKAGKLQESLIEKGREMDEQRIEMEKEINESEKRWEAILDSEKEKGKRKDEEIESLRSTLSGIRADRHQMKEIIRRFPHRLREAT
ncbi:hypothetical protein AAF712_016713 [Marasmius tenuissimus]|uniref:No apical meristem-associated C-terminal domain-containing protein n=1 Tax=Marasmius tenuissimus TaxID=585030 RepID=A0ABR2Z872_9AGAR